MAELKSANATITDVANLAGVSKKTVSRVINNEPNVRPETRERIQSAMSELNYFPNLSARSLASKRSYLVSLLYTQDTTFNIQSLVSALLQEFSQRNYSVLLQSCIDSDPQSLQTIENKARSVNVDGFILIPPLDAVPAVTDLLARLDKPLVNLSPRECVSQARDVACDDEKSVYDLTCHLISQGHSAIAFVKTDDDLYLSQSRFKGYQRALMANDIVLNNGWVISGGTGFDAGKAAGAQLLSLPDRPTAICCDSDDIAVGVLFSAREMGISVPESLALAGFGDDALVHKTWPPLTSVRQPASLIAEVAANKLIEQIQNLDSAEQRQHLPCSVAYRDSTEGWSKDGTSLKATHADICKA